MSVRVVADVLLYLVRGHGGGSHDDRTVLGISLRVFQILHTPRSDYIQDILHSSLN